MQERGGIEEREASHKIIPSTVLNYNEVSFGPCLQDDSWVSYNSSSPEPEPGDGIAILPVFRLEEQKVSSGGVVSSWT